MATLPRLRRLLPLLVLGAVVLLIVAAALASLAAPAAPRPPRAKNVIIMISDGCGFNHVDAASLFQYGKTGRQVYEKFPFRAALSTYPANGRGYDPAQAWGDFAWVKSGATDSAAAGTALATGVKTNNGCIGVSPSGRPLRSVIERAEELGKATGVVSSTALCDATPAAFVTHNPSRSNELAIGAAMVMDSAVEVLMATGHPWYDDSGRRKETPKYDYVGGEATWTALSAGTAGADCDRDGKPDPWRLVETRQQFRALARGATPKRVCGVPQAYETLHAARGGDFMAAPFATPLTANVPTITEMTKAALNVLDNDPDGFFLMVEAGAVDGAAHVNVAPRMVEEEIEFNRAVEAVVAWVERHSNWKDTLLIVTGDHETGYLTGPGSDPGWKPLTNNGAGKMPGLEWHSRSHTNSLLPFYAKGEAARLVSEYADEMDPVRGRYLDNTEVARLMFAAMR